LRPRFSLPCEAVSHVSWILLSTVPHHSRKIFPTPIYLPDPGLSKKTETHSPLSACSVLVWSAWRAPRRYTYSLSPCAGSPRPFRPLDFLSLRSRITPMHIEGARLPPNRNALKFVRLSRYRLVLAPPRNKNSASDLSMRSPFPRGLRLDLQTLLEPL